MSIRYAQQTRKKAKFQSPGHYTESDREKIPDEDFGDPSARKFPIVTQKDVRDAARLIGHASDPEAVKRRIVAIAKRKGFSLPAAWTEAASPPSEGGRMSTPQLPRTAASPEVVRSSEPTVTRAVAMPDIVRMAMPDAIRIVDEAKREIRVCATSERIDSYDTGFTFDASMDAFNRWPGNVREMHQPIAVGKRVAIEPETDTRKMWVRCRISEGAENTWKKIKDGTLNGASIGASNVVWEERRLADGQTKRFATKYDLVELSLVDNASNPDSQGIMILRAAGLDNDLLADLDTPAEETRTVESAPQRPKGVLVEGPASAAGVNPAIAAAMADAYSPSPAGMTAEVVRGTVAAQPTAALYSVGDQGVVLPQPDVSLAMASVPHVGLPTADGMDITSARQQRTAALEQRNARAAFITEAGEKAVMAANLPEPGVGQNYQNHAQRVAEVRAQAEIAAIRAWDQQQALAQPTTQRADPTQAVVFHEAAVPATLPETPMSASLAAHGNPNEPPSAQVNTETAEHVHDHEHTHADGTRHSHPHRHAHDDMTHRAAGLAHTEHGHVFLGGKPTDSSLVMADAARGVPWQIDAIHDQAQILHANPPTAASKSNVSQIAPVVASGEPTIYNKEDVKAQGFDTPADASSQIRPTPRENLTLDPAQFHQGGHKPDYNAEAGPMDDDGDYDHDEDEQEALHGAPVVSVPVPAFTAVNYDVEPTPMNRVAQAEETRIGARISGAGMEALHGARDSQMDAVRALCDHCGCEGCKAVILVLDGGGEEPDEDDLEDMGDEEDLRLSVAQILRTQEAQQTALVGLTEALIPIADSIEKAGSTDLAELRTQMADLTLTVADQQRSVTAQVSRAVHDQAQQTQAVLSTLIQQMTALAEVASATKASVEHIEAQPQVANVPQSRMEYPTDARFAQPYSTYMAAPEAMLTEAQRLASQLTPQQQAEIAARGILAQQQR